MHVALLLLLLLLLYSQLLRKLLWKIMDSMSIHDNDLYELRIEEVLS